MGDIEQSGVGELKFTIGNRFTDIYLANVYLQCMNPAIWFFLAIFLWTGYSFCFPVLLMKDYVLFGFSLARNLLIMAIFFFITPLFLIGALALMKRLKGVVGEHEYTFGPESYTRSSANNRLTLSYTNVVRFYETGKHFILMMQNMNGFIIPKRNLSSEVQAGLKEKLKGTKPVKKLYTHYVVFGLVIASMISLAVALPMAKYAVMTSAMPFNAVWDSNTLYISAGKTIVGQKIKYSDMLGLSAAFASMDEPPRITEQRLWVVRDGRIEPYIIQTTLMPIATCLYEGKLYAVHVDPKARKKVVSYFTPDAFVEDTSKTPQDIVKACGSAHERTAGQPMSAVSIYEWDDAVGNEKTLPLILGGAQFELGMKAEETEQAGLNPLDAESGKIVLSGRWVSNQEKKLETLYSVASGIKAVDRGTYERYFAK